MLNWLWDWLQEAVAWLAEFLQWLPLKLWELMLGAFASLMEAIPAPDWLENAGDAFGSIPAGVMYFCEPMHLDTGISIICGAYVVRFLIRRIPVIG